MNTQIHRKQMIILGLAMALAAASYWIPLPQQSEPYSSPLVLRESTNHSSASTETLAYAREPATIWRFPVTLQAPRTSLQTASAPPTEETQPDQAPAARLMDQQDFVKDGKTSFPLMPVKELNYDLKR